MPTDSNAFLSDQLGEPNVEAMRVSTVATRMVFDAPAADVWRSLVYYEEIGRPPPLHLRLLLPVPTGTEGNKSEVGNEAKCFYQDGHLLKRTTRVRKAELYEFVVARQELSVGGSLRLYGGRYALSELPNGRTEVTVETRYVSAKSPRWFWRPLEAMVCHWFHRYLLRSIRRTIESP